MHNNTLYFAGIFVTTSISSPEDLIFPETEQNTPLEDEGNELVINDKYWINPKKSPHLEITETPTPSIMETTIRPFSNTYP